MSKENRNWFMRHKVISAILALLLVIIIVGAASSSNSGINTTPSNNSNSQSTPQPSENQKTEVAHVGSAIDIGGSKGISVTLVKVFDPAPSDNQYFSADAGNRFVAVKLKITNNGVAAFNDNANNDVSLEGSDNQSYSADYSEVKGCTNFSHGDFKLAVNASVTGCVNFQLPNKVKPSKVQFTPNSGFSGSTGEWLIP